MTWKRCTRRPLTSQARCVPAALCGSRGVWLQRLRVPSDPAAYEVQALKIAYEQSRGKACARRGEPPAVVQNAKPMTAVQYKIQARKALVGATHVGARSKDQGTNFSSAVAPERLAATHMAEITFGASMYTCTEKQGMVKIRVNCTRSEISRPHSSIQPSS